MNTAEQNERCAHSGHPGSELVRFQMSNGALHYCMWCYSCDKNVSRDLDKRGRNYFGKEKVEAWLASEKRTPETVRIVNQFARIRMCYACQTPNYCEDDHVAERTIHGDFAERLPIVPLCGKCHHLKTNNLQEFMRRLRGGFVPCP